MPNYLGFMGQALTLRSARGWASYGGRTWAGEPVSPEIAMQIAAVWRCIRLTSSTLASLPFRLVAADGSGRQDRDIPLDTVIRSTPNPDMDAFDFWEAMIGAMELTGNGFARKLFSGTGATRQVIGLELKNPWGMTPQKRSNGQRYWQYVDANGYRFEYELDEVFQLKNFSFDGVMGMSTVAYGAQTISGARAAEKTAGEIFKSGLSSSGFLETAQVLNEPDRQRLQQIMSEYTGSGNAGRMMILENGMKYTPISMDPEDSQLLVSRQFSIEEVCRWFDVPPVLAFHAAQGVTNFGTGIESIILAWFQLALRNRIVRIQQAVYRQLMSPAQRVSWVPKYNFDALMQGDSQAKAALYSQYVQNGIRDRNEVRALDDLPPRDGAGELTAQVNLAPLSTLGDTSGDAQAAKAALRRFIGFDDAPTPSPALPAQR